MPKKGVEATVILAAIDCALAETQKTSPWVRLTQALCCDLPTGERNYAVGMWAKHRRPNSTDADVLRRRALLTATQRARDFHFAIFTSSGRCKTAADRTPEKVRTG